jgi:hypothetical protein
MLIIFPPISIDYFGPTQYSRLRKRIQRARYDQRHGIACQTGEAPCQRGRHETPFQVVAVGAAQHMDGNRVQRGDPGRGESPELRSRRSCIGCRQLQLEQVNSPRRTHLLPITEDRWRPTQAEPASKQRAKELQ